MKTYSEDPLTVQKLNNILLTKPQVKDEVSREIQNIVNAKKMRIQPIKFKGAAKGVLT